MTATQNDGTAPIAVVAAFQLKGDAAEFEKILREQGELMLAGDGFQYGVLARATGSPAIYVNIAWWRDSMSYLSVVRSYAFASRAMSGVGRLADTRLDRLVPLTGDGSLLPPAGSEDAVLGLSEYTLDEGADAAAFEREAVAAGARVDDRELDLVLVGVQVEEEVVRLVDDLLDARVGAVRLV
ncbi:hypothetical protein JFN87_21640, partial [Streptomyces bomunensis]|nr:hypothetical protein [Streptomyces montanisoli]